MELNLLKYCKNLAESNTAEHCLSVCARQVTWGHPNIPMHHWSERPIVRKTNSPTDH